MRSTARFGSAVGRHRFLTGCIAASAVVVALATTLGGVAAASVSQPRHTTHHAPRATGTVVDEVTGTFGPMLVIGSGSGKGTALYVITSDYGTHFGCTATVVTVLGQKDQCTGPASDSNAEWPALLTAAAPVAGPGVTAKLLGEVNRAGIGEQVTYAGHPLYGFDSIPGVLTGEGWDEATLPPWHGVWNLVSPSGNFLPPAETLATTKTWKGTTVLAAVMTVGGGSIAFPLYNLSGATSCPGSCIETWIPLLTGGTPGLLDGLSPKLVGSVKLSNGTYQVTFSGKPVYLYGNEAISLATGFPEPEGNGNGVAAPAPVKGTFELAAP
jgi:predicted lipoprotein with Yx(FWY)xxD motif